VGFIFEKGMMVSRIALISSVVPQPLLGGEVILWRHLKELQRCFPALQLLIVSSAKIPKRERLPARYYEVRGKQAFKRIKNTRFGFFYHDYNSLGCSVCFSELVFVVREFNPDIILTVVHGELFIQAIKTAKILRKPLVSVFHDWWPDVPPVSRLGRLLLERKFREAGRLSTRALCVCENMARDINSANASILYPVPSPARRANEVAFRDTDKEFVIRYAGTLQGTYGRMVYFLFKFLSGHPRIRLEISGGSPNWTDQELAEVGNNYQGMLPVSELPAFISGSDLLLIVMSFEKSERRRARTSFPSKIVEYCAYGRPMLLWAPEYASATEWARKTGACLHVEQNDTEAVLRRIEGASAEQLATLGNRVRELSQGEFSFEAIHSQFESALLEVGVPHPPAGKR
jgi:hypothetical protein